MHGLGNRLHLLQDDAFCAGSDEAVRACSEHRADGLMVHGRTDDGVYSAVIWNADGTRAELCGNGLRCLARLGVEQGWLHGGGDALRSDVGTHQIRMEDDGRVTTSMPLPVHGADAVGLVDPAAAAISVSDPIASCQFGDELLDMHLVATGNPHAIIFVPVERHAELLPAIAGMLQQSKAFLRGVNVHAADVDDGVMRLSSWERGVGSTPACASGATAAVSAAAGIGLVSSGALVQMSGGELEVRLQPEIVWNTGMAEHVECWTLNMEQFDADPSLRA